MMRNKLRQFCVVLNVLLLSSCAYYAPYQQRHLCYADCAQRCQHCQNVCDQDALLCNKKADAVAAVHFKHYLQQRKVKGQLPTATLKAFRDPLACMQPSCDCVLDKRMCRQACDGVIYKRLQTVQ